jgi:hypothetical protein
LALAVYHSIANTLGHVYGEVRAATVAVARTLEVLLHVGPLKTLIRWIIFAVVLIYLRLFILRNIPWLVKHSKFVEVTVNIVLGIIVAIEDAVKLIVLAIQEIIDMIRTLMGHPHTPTVNWAKMHFVTIAETIARLTDIGRVCGDVNTGPKAAVALFRAGLNQPLCPIVRAAWPTNAQGITNAVMGWATYTPDPGQMAHSCRPDDDETVLAFCGGLGAGFILAEIVLPVVIVGIFVHELWKGRKKPD